MNVDKLLTRVARLREQVTKANEAYDAALLAAYENGCTTEELAGALGVTRQAVSQKLILLRRRKRFA